MTIIVVINSYFVKILSDCWRNCWLEVRMLNRFTLIVVFIVSNIAIVNSLMILAAHLKETTNLFLLKVLMHWHCCSFLTIKTKILGYSCLKKQTIEHDCFSKIVLNYLLSLAKGSLWWRVLREKWLRLIWFFLLLTRNWSKSTWVISLSIWIS